MLALLFIRNEKSLAREHSPADRMMDALGNFVGVVVDRVVVDVLIALNGGSLAYVGYERPDGTLVRKRIISGYPERACDGPTPKGLPPWRTGASRDTQGLVRLSEQDARLNDLCLDDDLAAGWNHVDHGEEETSNH